MLRVALQRAGSVPAEHGAAVAVGHELWEVGDLQKAAGYRDSRPVAVSAVYLAPPFNRRKERFKSVSAEVIRQNDATFDAGLLADFVAAVRQAKEAK